MLTMFKRRRMVRRETERRIARVGLVSVALVSFIVSVLLAGTVFLAGIVLWRYGVGTGVVERAEELVSNFTADGTFVLDGPTLFAGWAMVMAVWAGALTLLGVLLGVIVNFACFVTGGIRLRLRWKVPAEAVAAGSPAARRDERAGLDSDDELEGQQRIDLDALEPSIPVPSVAGTTAAATNGSSNGDDRSPGLVTGPGTGDLTTGAPRRSPRRSPADHRRNGSRHPISAGR